MIISKLTNLLIPLVLISTGVISCANYGFVKRNDITNQQFVNTINQNSTERQIYPQPEKENITSQAVVANTPTKKLPSPMPNTENKQSDNKPIDKEHVNNLPVMEQVQIKLNQVGLAHLALGIAYAESDQIDQAISEFQSAIEANPHHLEPYVRLGTTYGLKGMTNEALSEFKKAMDINLNEAVAKIVFSALPVTVSQKVNTNVVKAHINLGNAYKEEGELERSQLEYEKALELKPEHPIARKSLSEIYYSYGTSYLENQKYDDAIDAFNRVLELNPGFPQIKDSLEKAHYNLGINYAKEGELNKAIIEFNKTMEINLNYAMLDKSNLNLISKDKKTVSDKHVHSSKSHSGKNVHDTTNKDLRTERFHEEEEETLQDQMPHQIDAAEEMTLAEKSNEEKPEYDQNQGENEHPLLLSQKDKKQIQEKIAHVKSVDTEVTNLASLDQERNASLQVRGEENAENSNTYNLGNEKEISIESLAQFNQPEEDKIIAIQANSSGEKAVAKNKVSANYRVYTYNITRNYKTKIGVNEAIKKYEDATINNPYDNNAFLNLAHAYYCKAMHLDDAIARREDASEGNQNFSVKRFYLNDAGDEENSETGLIEQTNTFENTLAFRNRSGNMYEEMFREAIVEYKNALRINPNSSNSLYGLAFSFSKKGLYPGIALKSKNNPNRSLSEF